MAQPASETNGQYTTVVQCRGCADGSREPEIATLLTFVADYNNEKAAELAKRIAGSCFVEIELPYYQAAQLASGLRRADVVSEVMSGPPPNPGEILPARYHFLSFCWGVPGILLRILGEIISSLGYYWFKESTVSESLSKSIILVGFMIAVGSSILIIIGLGHYARAKGHSAAWGVLGVFGIFGLIALACLPDKHRGTRLETRSSYIKFICPHCRLITEIDKSFAGEKGPCRGCGKQITVPRC